ncbi:MAG: HD domain-containing protein [Candidatus Methylacidiphilales bacterium]|nr:HD domain-containing protein [Candidatus Methylacidiphilales bacterium]
MKLPPDPLLREARTLMRKLEPEPAHVLQVARLADQLFLELQPLHRLGARDRLLLAAAAWLHDTGWSVSPDGRAHHKHSARLIRCHPWKHLNKEEKEMVAQTARYHRRTLPTLKQSRHARLSSEARERVCALASLLRVADALDRSHRSRIRRITAAVGDAAVEIRARAREAAGEEEAAFLKKRDLFLRHYDLPVHLRLDFARQVRV